MNGIKSLTMKLLPEKLANDLRRLRRLLGYELYEPAPVDNTYEWLNYSFLEILRDNRSATRPSYIWGVLQGASLAKVLGLPRVSVIEFGVAGGGGLIALERIAEAVERKTELAIVWV